MIKLPAYLVGYNRKADRSCSIRLETQELTSEQLLELDKHYGAFGWLLFKENNFNESDIPEIQAEDKNKTPSKRLKNVLYKYSMQQGVPKDKFEMFYREYMEKFIKVVMDKLD